MATRTKTCAFLLSLLTSSAYAIEHRLVVNGDGDFLQNGQALRAAVAQTAADPTGVWLIDIGPGQFNISGVDSIYLPDNVHLRGAGQLATTLFFNANGGSLRPAIRTSGANELSGLSLSQNCFGGIKDCAALQVYPNPNKQVRLSDVRIFSQGGVTNTHGIVSLGNLSLFNTNLSANAGNLSRNTIGIEQRQSGLLEIRSSQVQSVFGSVSSIGIFLTAGGAKSVVRDSNINAATGAAGATAHWQYVAFGSANVMGSELFGSNFGGFSCQANVVNGAFLATGCGN
jgi:hypothetical protein